LKIFEAIVKLNTGLKVSVRSTTISDYDVRSEKIHNKNSCKLYSIQIKIFFNKTTFTIDKINL